MCSQRSSIYLLADAWKPCVCVFVQRGCVAQMKLFLCIEFIGLFNLEKLWAMMIECLQLTRLRLRGLGVLAFVRLTCTQWERIYWHLLNHLLHITGRWTCSAQLDRAMGFTAVWTFCFDFRANRCRRSGAVKFTVEIRQENWFGDHIAYASIKIVPHARPNAIIGHV